MLDASTVAPKVFTHRYSGRMTSKMRIISTASDWLDSALKECDSEVVLSSPYLAFNICKLVADAARGSSQTWTLLTTLDASAVANGYLSVQGLEIMLDAGIQVRHVDRLHAKCFIVGARAMLGSANLTGAGLGSSSSSNRELGVELSSEQAQEVRKLVFSWPARSVKSIDLEELLAQSKNLTRTTRGPAPALNAESALHLAEQLLADARDAQRGLWLKLEYGAPALDGWREESWFASPKKGKPGFRPGDLVFICAKNTSDCYAVVEVTSDAEFQPQDYVNWIIAQRPEDLERYPWINRTKPRLVPSTLMELKSTELGASGQGLRNGHVRLKFDQFTAGVRALARLATD